MSYELFILAHPDDELPVYPLLMRAQAKGAVVAYLTNGLVEGLAAPEVRKTETMRSLALINQTDVLWIGIEASIAVYRLHLEAASALEALRKAVAARGVPLRIVTHAWEGGHGDHDACHLIALKLAGECGILELSISSPYYRAPAGGPVPFLIMSPLANNGPTNRLRATLRERQMLLRAALCHSSQLKPLLGLSPALLWKTFISGRFDLQGLSSTSAPARPMPSKLLYEIRNDLPFSDFITSMAKQLG